MIDRKRLGECRRETGGVGIPGCVPKVDTCSETEAIKGRAVSLKGRAESVMDSCGSSVVVLAFPSLCGAVRE